MTLLLASRTTARVVTAIVLGYSATAGLAALLTVLIVLAGSASRLDAFIMVGSFSWVAWSAFFLWAFAARRLGLMIALMATLAVCGHLAAYLIEPLLPVTGAS